MKKITNIFFIPAAAVGSGLLLYFFAVGLLDGSAMAQKVDNCAFYEKVYISGNKQLSSIFVEGIGDDSAPRETSRQLRALNVRMEQLIVIQQMQSIGCKLPEQISSISHYLSPALDCGNARLRGNSESPKCDRDTWVSATGE